VKGKLESEAQQEVVTALLQELRKDAKIEIKTPPAAVPPADGAVAPPAGQGTTQPGAVVQ
jgi:hypothetical protein